MTRSRSHSWSKMHHVLRMEEHLVEKISEVSEEVLEGAEVAEAAVSHHLNPKIVISILKLYVLQPTCTVSHHKHIQIQIINKLMQTSPIQKAAIEIDNDFACAMSLVVKPSEPSLCQYVCKQRLATTVSMLDIGFNSASAKSFKIMGFSGVGMSFWIICLLDGNICAFMLLSYRKNSIK